MDPLADLRDIRLPAEPAWWPPAPGWWLLAVLLLLMLAALAWWALRWHRHRRPARAAKRILVGIESDYAEDGDAARAARRLSALLRRYLLARFRREEVAGIQGEHWVDFIRARARGKGPDADRMSDLLQAPYRRDGGDVPGLAALVRAVIDATSGRGAGGAPHPPSHTSR